MESKLRRLSPLLPVLLAVLSLPGGAAPAKTGDAERLSKVVARVGGTTITVGDIESRLQRHMRPGIFEDREELKNLVNSMIDRELLVEEARRRKLDEEKRVVNHLKRILYNQIQTRYVTEQMPLDSITSEEIQAYYDEHADEYNQPTLVRAYHILVKDGSEAENVLEQVKQEGMDLRQFKVLAGEKSQDEVSKKRGGDLRYFDAGGKVWTSEEVVPAPVAAAAFSLEIQVRASVLVTDDPEKAKELLDKAMMPGLSESGFAKLLAKARAEGATRSRDLGFFSLEGQVKGGGEPVSWDLTRAAFSMRDPGKTYPKVIRVGDEYHVLRVTDRKDPGNLYPELVESDAGFHIVWVVNRRPSVSKTVEEMEPAIRQRIWQEKKKDFMTKLVEDLKKKHGVVVHEERLDDVVIDLSSQPAGAEHPVIPPTPMEQPHVKQPAVPAQ